MPKTSCEILFRYVFAFARKLLLLTELTGGVNQTQRGGGRGRGVGIPPLC